MISISKEHSFEAFHFERSTIKTRLKKEFPGYEIIENKFPFYSI